MRVDSGVGSRYSVGGRSSNKWSVTSSMTVVNVCQQSSIGLTSSDLSEGVWFSLSLSLSLAVVDMRVDSGVGSRYSVGGRSSNNWSVTSSMTVVNVCQQSSIGLSSGDLSEGPM